MNRRIALGIGLLIAVAFLINVNWCGWLGTCPQPPVNIAFGFTGGSKDGLLKDADVVRIMRERYQIEVQSQSLGSLEQCDLTQAQLAKTDWLWPGNELALERCKQRLGATMKSVETFHSPIVFYSWAKVTDALVQHQLVQREGDVYYIADMVRFTHLLVEEPPDWKDVGLPELFGKFLVRSSDPTKSNSGNVSGALLATILNGSDVPDDVTSERLGPAVKKWFVRQGAMPPSTSELFKQCVGTGYGKCPIFVAYESLMIEYLLANTSKDDQIQNEIRFLYPKPTEYGRHTLIALNARGERMQQALLDPDIQQIARQKHGFRIGRDRPVDIPGLADSIESVIQLPAPRVMDRLTILIDQSAH